MKLKKYRVYFEQINAQYYDVEANGRDSAVTKAEKLWKQENGPYARHVDLKGEKP